MKLRIKRAISAFLAFVMIFSTSVPTLGAVTFTDIDGTYPAAREAIQKWASYGIVHGVGDDRFGPLLHFTRAQMAAMMDRIMGYTEMAPNTFTDLQEDRWFTSSVLRAVHAGVFDPLGNFRAEQYITREETAMAFARALGLNIQPEHLGSTHFIDDAAISHQARPAIHAVLQQRIVQGFNVGDGSFEFRPQDHIRRQDMMVMFSNAIYTIVSRPTTGIVTVRFVIVNTPGVTITDSTIGNLILTQGVGRGYVYLYNVQVHDEVQVRSANSVLNLQGNTVIPNLRVLLSTEHDLVTINADASANISSLSIEQGTVKLNGHVNELTVYGNNTTVHINGSVDTLDIFGNNVTVYVNGEVGETTVVGNNVTIHTHEDDEDEVHEIIYEDDEDDEEDEPTAPGRQPARRPSIPLIPIHDTPPSVPYTPAPPAPPVPPIPPTPPIPPIPPNGGGDETPTEPEIILVIVPATVIITVGDSYDFVVQNQEDPGINLPYTDIVWTIEGAICEGTTINAQGRLYISENETATTITVRAALANDLTVYALATVTIVDLLPPENIRIDGNYTASTTTITWDPVTNSGHAIYRATSVFGQYVRVGVVPAGTNTWTDTTQGSDTPLSQAFYYRVKAVAGEFYSKMSEEWASRETDFWGPNVLIWSEDDDYLEINTLAQGIFREPGTGWSFFYNAAGARELRPCPHTGAPSAGEIYRDPVTGDYIRGRGTETAQFGDERYAFFFKPGDFSNVGFDVGFYTHIVGLGRVPTDTRIGRLSVTAQWRGTVHYPARNSSFPDRNYIGNSTCNFWRTMENVHLLSNTMWGVSQAAPLRRLYIDGNLTLATVYPTAEGGNWASGGFLADSIIRGNLSYTGQQQWFTRNTEYGAATGGQWNMVHLGTRGNSPAHGHNNGSWTNLPYAQRTVEKPFVYINNDGHYAVFVPTLRTNTYGVSWCPTTRDMGEGSSLPVIGSFYVARPETSTTATFNNAIAAGYHVIITPGIYNLTSTIYVNRADTIILGLGLPSLVNQGDFNHMVVGDVDGVRIAGIIFDAGEGYNSPIMLQVGITSRAYNSYHGTSNTLVPANPNNPIVISDVVFRIGGPIEARIGTAIEIRRDHAIGDHFWTWRADHGVRPWDYEVYGKQTQVGWFMNETINGTIIYADHFIMYALMNEHFHEYQLIWFGNYGRLYFYQSELPYDPRTQDEWSPGPGTRGWRPGNSTRGFASYKVYDGVTHHTAFGIGIYAVPSNTGGTGWTQRNPHPVFVQLENAIEVPHAPGVHIWHACILNFANPMITYNPDYPNTPCPIRSHPRFIEDFDGDFALARAGLEGHPTYCQRFPAIANVINGVGGGTWATVRSGWVIHFNNPPVGTVDFYIDGVPAPAMGRYSQQPLVELRFSDPSVEIRFTLDGTEPTRNSQLYTVPFLVGELEQIVRVRAAAFGIDGSGTAASEIRIGLSRSNNVARFRPVRASSQTGGQPARGAVDGRGGRADGFVVPGTGGEAAGADARWAAADLNTGNPAMAQWGNRNQWIMVDLESEIPIDEIIITWQSQAGRLVEGQIAFSNDPSVWTAPSPWVEGLFGREGPRVLDSRWTQLVPLSTVSPTVRYPNPTINTNVAINANPPMFNPSLPGITVDYRQVDLGGRRPRHTVDLSSENITARFVVIDIRRSFDFAPSIWEIEIYAAMADPFVIEGIAQPLAGDAAGAITGITTPDPNITLSNIQLIGATGAGNTFAEGDVPQITFTANVNPATGGFNEEIWSGGNAAGLISAVGSTAITFTRVSNTEITVTISLMTIAPRQSITAPAAATVNGLTLTAVFQDSLGIARNEFAEGETVTVVLHAAGTPADNTRAAIYELNLTSSQVTIASGRPELNMLAASNWVTTPAAIAVTLAPVEPTTQTFNLRPGASPGAGNPLYPAGGFIYTFIMPDAAVTDLQLHFDVRFNLLGYFERHTAGTPSPDFDRARASSVAGATYNPLRNAVNAFNGLYNGDNRWESANNDVSTRSNHPGWIIVDLGAVYDVSDVVITWQSQNASSPTFQILLTDDPDLWNDPRATGANANVVGAISQEQVDNWLSWRADPRWNVAWAANIGPRNTADLTSFASLSRGTTTIIPWRAGTDGAVTFAPRGEVTINGGGTGRYLMFWGDLNGNSGGSFGYSIWEIEVYGTRVSP